eukprot:gnl/TRDRNA2_/TRDRNA2_152824_c1_seq1.p1 gnl/TRDRNA2_/TRDRNA2_152824_c1~~gnl/TRDRNA2_/TRDRNA2_152824_c1_seq1.p1  ORF type:complete len:478 (+),score=90.82 gnl/TRDRNA2_/TRDRNA2_152824_c1_seq1:30-1436(+)
MAAETRRRAWRQLPADAGSRMLALGSFQLYIAAALSSSVASPVHPAVGSLEEVPAEQLFQLVAHELEKEDSRGQEGILPFSHYEDIAVLDCQDRLMVLMNQTAWISETMRSYHGDFVGLSGLFWSLLERAPDETSWIWLLANSQERIVDRVHAFFARVEVVALDQHQCLTVSVRTTMLDAATHWKRLYGELMALQWRGFAFGSFGDPAGAVSNDGSPAKAWSESIVASLAWISSAADWLEALVRDMYAVLVREVRKDAERHSDGSTARLHHQDERGMFVPFEYLRRKHFSQWALDKGLLRGLLRYVWQPPYEKDGPSLSIGDFGAGGGQYSTWLNETGLVQSFAFDGTAQASEISGGAVQEVNLIEELHLWRKFDWVLCLEVGEHIPSQFTRGLLQNLNNHAVKGLVMSWSNDWEGIGHVNCLSKEEFVSLVQNETGFVIDHEATEKVSAGCEIDYIARSIAVFRSQL